MMVEGLIWLYLISHGLPREKRGSTGVVVEKGVGGKGKEGDSCYVLKLTYPPSLYFLTPEF